MSLKYGSNFTPTPPHHSEPPVFFQAHYVWKLWDLNTRTEYSTSTTTSRASDEWPPQTQKCWWRNAFLFWSVCPLWSKFTAWMWLLYVQVSVHCWSVWPYCLGVCEILVTVLRSAFHALKPAGEIHACLISFIIWCVGRETCACMHAYVYVYNLKWHLMIGFE